MATSEDIKMAVDIPWSGVSGVGVRDAVGPPCNPQRVHSRGLDKEMHDGREP
jgi:hypothetical protein